MIRCTFQLVPGVGPFKERQLWSAGVRSWDDLARGGASLSPALRDRLARAVEAARAALEAGDAEALAALLPRRERWRLYAAFEADAACVDVERDGERVTAVGVLDRSGPRVLLRGRDLDAFPEVARGWKLLVTYNGDAFDVPALEAAYPGWRAPRAHVDLRHLWARLGHEGGLKLLEERTGLDRPSHVAALRGGDAVRLWRSHEAGDGDALYRLAEYNLYDTVNLKALAVLGYNRMVERLALPAPSLPPWHRGDVLYDMTKALLEVAAAPAAVALDLRGPRR